MAQGAKDPSSAASTDSESPQTSPGAVFGNIFVFIKARYETSANTLKDAVTLLACRPDIQKALRADLGKTKSSVTILDGYVEATVDETLRLYTLLPIFPKTTREIPHSFSISSSGYTIPADTLILMNTSATHRNPKYWPAAVPTAGDGPPYRVPSFDRSH
ncbi:hypothetical protein HO133_006323 [Letharia lupina]|uniref:Uncharacterized protein n=1 Tax=Letharia lupina TaxID=560253 RepID=A0A8H6F7K5_9LECA|nr:uncharacterized protein HO133_006323 [Letharia lupina]KAF6217911.1 hypothetical protein HO133_006323 [Letharia lupina]